METFKTTAEAAAHLKVRPVQSQCITTGGGRLNRSLKIAFHGYGLRVKVDGLKGNRTITLLEPYNEALENHRFKTQTAYRKKHAAATQRPVSEYGNNLKVGESVICTGTDGQKVRDYLVGQYGEWTCTVSTSDEGWVVTRHSAQPNQALIESLRPKKKKP